MGQNAIYYKGKSYSGGGDGSGTEVIPNPQDTPTDTLNTVSIDGTIYDIASGGGGSGYSETTLWENASGLSFNGNNQQTVTLSDNMSNYDMLCLVYRDGTYTTERALSIHLVSEIDTTGNIGFWLTPVLPENNLTSPRSYYVSDNQIRLVGISAKVTMVAFKIIGVKFGGGGGATFEGLDYSNATDLTLPDNTGYTYTPSENGVIMVDNYGGAGALTISSANFNPIHLMSAGDRWTTSWCFVEKGVEYTLSRSSSSSGWQSQAWAKFIPLKQSSSGGGTEVIANPEDAATDTLTKLSVDGDVYEIPEINVEDVYVNGTSALDENNVAQIKSYQEITKAEYDALPSSKLTDDILYCITDGGATEPGEYFNPIIYSLTEREIGVWTDGKPLYQRTMTISVNNNVTEWTLIDDTVSYDKLICSNGIVYVNITNPTWISHNSNRESSPRIAILPDHKLYYWAENLATEYNWMYQFTIQYTKTSDIPGSGKYTTLGVPSVHYSTDEQVIGTWIDGKTLYQKSFIINPLTVYSTKTALPSSILTELSDIDTCIGGFCVRHKSEGVTSNATPLSVWIDGATMYVYSINQCNNMTHFTFQYTKTTD